jgi:hypothetical protein
MKCKHCGRGITNVGSDGKVYKSYTHTEGAQGGLHRCWPGDTGRPYGLDAEPAE